MKREVAYHIPEAMVEYVTGLGGGKVSVPEEGSLTQRLPQGDWDPEEGKRGK